MDEEQWFSIRVKKQNFELFKKLCKKDFRSMNSMLNELIENYLMEATKKWKKKLTV